MLFALRTPQGAMRLPLVFIVVSTIFIRDGEWRSRITGKGRSWFGCAPKRRAANIKVRAVRRRSASGHRSVRDAFQNGMRQIAPAVRGGRCDVPRAYAHLRPLAEERWSYAAIVEREAPCRILNQ
jgi:hypothetical protein